MAGRTKNILDTELEQLINRIAEEKRQKAEAAGGEELEQYNKEYEEYLSVMKHNGRMKKPTIQKFPAIIKFLGISLKELLELNGAIVEWPTEEDKAVYEKLHQFTIRDKRELMGLFEDIGPDFLKDTAIMTSLDTPTKRIRYCSLFRKHPTDMKQILKRCGDDAFNVWNDTKQFSVLKLNDVIYLARELGISPAWALCLPKGATLLASTWQEEQAMADYLLLGENEKRVAFNYIVEIEEEEG